jgi:hypothetical protein
MYLTKIKQMSAAARTSTADSDTSCASSAASLAPPPAPSSGRAADKQTPLAATTSIAESATTTDDAASASVEMAPRDRDALWAAFNDIDAEHAAVFRAPKPNPYRAVAAVRSALLGFLRVNESHPSNNRLHPDDLERRATILNKWWTSMLEMHEATGDGREPVLAIHDRAVLLEAMAKIMMRPEWRQASRAWLPHDERAEAEPDEEEGDDDDDDTTSYTSSSSDASPTSAPSSASPRRAVALMFTRNLTRQMLLVTTKMSLRHIHHSVAFFAGKACAYAFFFLPGAAEVMIRLWGLRADVLRAAAKELGLPARPGFKSPQSAAAATGDADADAAAAADVVAAFPACMAGLTWAGSRAGVRFRTTAAAAATAPPASVAQVQWDGLWVSRWKGRDTDLVFIFFKYFFILFAEFVPPGLPLATQAQHAPALPFVLAQLLETIDATVHRQASLAIEQQQRLGPIGVAAASEGATSPGPGGGGVGATNSAAPSAGPPLADAQHGSDASMAALQFPSNNLRRLMSENRLIVMFRDVFSSRMDGAPAARHTFAEAAMVMLHAATKRTSRFDQMACVTLCDFLEEALLAYSSGFGGGGGDQVLDDAAVVDMADRPGLAYVDWRFWLDAINKMLEGHHNITVIRVLSFTYAVWDVLVADPARKEEVCLGWLLEERMFNHFFNHWCPMVRSYWMRLLCWRVCRDMGGAANDLDGWVL